MLLRKPKKSKSSSVDKKSSHPAAPTDHKLDGRLGVLPSFASVHRMCVKCATPPLRIRGKAWTLHRAIGGKELCEARVSQFNRSAETNVKHGQGGASFLGRSAANCSTQNCEEPDSKCDLFDDSYTSAVSTTFHFRRIAPYSERHVFEFQLLA